MIKDKTLDYYNLNAERYVQDTRDVDFTDNQERFLERFPEGGYLLDFGCGSGRDTKYFLERGFKVDASDGSEKLCGMASEYTGIAVRHMMFEELDEKEKYDGIWACSSILHLTKDVLKCVMDRMAEALKTDGVIYTCFKYGDFEGERDGRFYTDFTSGSFEEFIEVIPRLYIVDLWTTGDVRPGRGEEKWLNLILQKQDIR